jgi:predicted alpha/beta-fold hydrolase
MLKKAMENRYKCVIINFRGYSGVKLTSGKVFCSGLWEDYKEPVDFIFDKYCSGKEGTNKRRIYGYGVSLGAAVLTLYLVSEGDKSPLSGAILYANPFNVRKNIPYLRNSFYGIYSIGMVSYYYSIVNDQLP